jgi:hypothetical protein
LPLANAICQGQAEEEEHPGVESGEENGIRLNNDAFSCQFWHSMEE